MDGLMIDSERVTFRAFTEICAEYGFEMTLDFYKTLIGHNVADIKQLIRDEAGSDFPVEVLAEKVAAYLERDFYEINGIPIKPGLPELLTYVKERGWKTFVVTSSSRDRVDKILATAGIAGYFSGSVCGDEVTNGKPDPECFETALRKAGVQPDEACVLEDSEMGIMAAYKAGIPAICVPDMIDPRQEIRDMTVYIGETLFDVLEHFKEQY